MSICPPGRPRAEEGVAVEEDEHRDTTPSNIITTSSNPCITTPTMLRRTRPSTTPRCTHTRITRTAPCSRQRTCRIKQHRPTDHLPRCSTSSSSTSTPRWLASVSSKATPRGILNNNPQSSRTLTSLPPFPPLFRRRHLLPRIPRTLLRPPRHLPLSPQRPPNRNPSNPR